MNKAFFIGNLTRDPELTETPSGISICRFSIAVNRNYTDESGERITDFFNCTAWRKAGETIAQYCKKGNKISVTGSVRPRSYEDNNGTKHTTVDIIVEEFEFLTPKSAQNDEGTNGQGNTRPIKNGANKPTLQPVIDGVDNDIPF